MWYFQITRGKPPVGYESGTARVSMKTSNGMRTVVFDIETKNEFKDVGSSDPSALDISVVGIYDSGSDSYATYAEEDFPKLWPILERTDVLVGFNSEHFDIPLLDKYYPGDLTRIRSIDLLRAVKDSLGRRLKLDTIAEATLGVKKSGNGLEAITWWRNGEHDKVRAYCLMDVKITKELFDYAKAHGVLKYRDLGTVRDIPIDTSGWGEAPSHAMTQSLPF